MRALYISAVCERQNDLYLICGIIVVLDGPCLSDEHSEAYHSSPVDRCLTLWVGFSRRCA